MSWGVAEAKQQLSRVLKAAKAEPQLIRTRGALVAAVLGPSDAEAYLAWKKEHERPTLAEVFAEAQQICDEEDITLVPPPRVDRSSTFGASRAKKRRKG